MQKSLIAPRVSNCFDGKINYFGYKNGIQVMIPAYPGASYKDSVKLIWDDFEKNIIVGDVNDFPFIYDVSKDFPPTCLNDGIHTVKYIVTDLSGNVVQSNSVEFTVSTKC